MARREQEILKHAVHTVAEQAAKADDLVDEAIAVGHGRSDPLVTHAKMLRLELLKVKADLERELETLSLHCSKCGLDVHQVSGLGISPLHLSMCPQASFLPFCSRHIKTHRRSPCPCGRYAAYREPDALGSARRLAVRPRN